MTKTALITGVTGQDGAYLSKMLIDKGYKVYGSFRRSSTPNFWRLQYLNIIDRIDLVPMDMIDLSSILEAIDRSQPDEIYHLAAQSFVGRSFEEPVSTSEVTGIGTTRLLEAARIIKKDTRIYLAATSELFGDDSSSTKTETTSFSPQSPYAVAKLYSYWIGEMYKNGYGMFVSNGILFNHESPLRGLEFVTRKVTNAVAKIKLGIQKKLSLGNINAIRDWGYAADYVEAMWLMLQQDSPDNFVIATGVGHSVKDLVDQTFKMANLNPYDYIVHESHLNRLIDVNNLVGDYSKAKDEIGWVPKTTFKDLVAKMYESDLSRWTDFINGKPVLWDGPLYSDEARVINVRYSVKV